MYECFHCGMRTVILDCDHTFKDMMLGYEGDGLIRIFHCENCGAQIEYWIPEKGEDE